MKEYSAHTVKGMCRLMVFLFSDACFLSPPPPTELRTVHLVHRRDRCDYPQERRGVEGHGEEDCCSDADLHGR